MTIDKISGVEKEERSKVGKPKKELLKRKKK